MLCLYELYIRLHFVKNNCMLVDDIFKITKLKMIGLNMMMFKVNVFVITI